MNVQLIRPDLFIGLFGDGRPAERSVGFKPARRFSVWLQRRIVR